MIERILAGIVILLSMLWFWALLHYADARRKE